MTKKTLKATVTAVLLVSAGAAVAQVSIIRPAYQYPAAVTGSGSAASVQMGDSPVYFTPYIGAGYGHDDNLFQSNVAARSSNFYVVSPGLKLDARSSNTVVQASFQSQLGRYSDSENDDYIDHFAHIQVDTAFDRRNFFRAGYDYVYGHDPRGSTDRGISNRPDKYTLSTPYVTYAFGAPGAQGRMELYYGDARRRYLNNRDVTFASDRNTQEFGGVLYWRAMPRTYVLGEARRTDFSYLDPASQFNSREDRYYLGVSWEATASTTGTVKVGRLQKRFESDVPKFKDTAYEALVTWAPRTYSKFDFYATRTPNESTGLGDFILTDVVGATWTHSWTSVLSTAIDGRYQKDRYKGFDRTDELKSLGFKVGYKFRRWLTFGAEYTYTQRDSNQQIYEYDRNIYLLTATASM